MSVKILGFLLFAITVEKIKTQEEEICSASVQPVSYSYLNGSFCCQDFEANGCVVDRNIDTQTYISCTSSLLSDNSLGPANFNESMNKGYYIWNNSGQRQVMLFTFSQNITLTNIEIVYYYYGRGRPKLRFYLVEDNFQVWDAINNNRISITLDNDVLGENNTGRQTSTKRLNGITSKIAMEIVNDKKFRSVQSELTFCTNGKCLINVRK